MRKPNKRVSVLETVKFDPNRMLLHASRTGFQNHCAKVKIPTLR